MQMVDDGIEKRCMQCHQGCDQTESEADTAERHERVRQAREREQAAHEQCAGPTE